MFTVDVVPVMLDGFAATVRPDGAPLTARFTAPAKPLLRVRVTVALSLAPCFTVMAFDDSAIVKPCALEVKVASTLACVPDVVTVHVVVVPEHAPPQPPNVLPELGVAVSVTLVPKGNAAEHVPPHVIPAGLEVTVPLPVPALDTLTRCPVRMRPTA